MKLSASEVNRIFKECLSVSSSSQSSTVTIAQGVLYRASFDTEKLKNYETSMREILNELPDDFQKNKGGGMSFLNMCMDKHGNYWTGSHATMDALVMLGNAIGAVSFNLPPQFWPILPGGMPYVVVK